MKTVDSTLVEGISAPLAADLQLTLERITEADACLMVYLDGAVTTANTPALEERVSYLIQQGWTNLIFNCTALSRISSAGVGSFAAFVRLLKNAGGDIVLLMVQPVVAEILDILGFSAFLNIRGSTAEALAFFRKKQDQGREEGRFPRDFACPECRGELTAPAPGRYRCAACKSVFTVNDGGQVFLG
jgi:anti-anti-sigma factor